MNNKNNECVASINFYHNKETNNTDVKIDFSPAVDLSNEKDPLSPAQQLALSVYNNLTNLAKEVAEDV